MLPRNLFPKNFLQLIANKKFQKLSTLQKEEQEENMRLLQKHTSHPTSWIYASEIIHILLFRLCSFSAMFNSFFKNVSCIIKFLYIRTLYGLQLNKKKSNDACEYLRKMMYSLCHVQMTKTLLS